MDFATEIREAFEKKYIKVFLKESDDIELVKSTLEQIKSIHKVNITESHSGSIGGSIAPCQMLYYLRDTSVIAGA